MLVLVIIVIIITIIIITVILTGDGATVPLITVACSTKKEKNDESNLSLSLFVSFIRVSFTLLLHGQKRSSANGRMGTDGPPFVLGKLDPQQKVGRQGQL
jgi:hypothetical protein